MHVFALKELENFMQQGFADRECECSWQLFLHPQSVGGDFCVARFL